MSRDKQIEEMAKDFDTVMQRRCFHRSCNECEFDRYDTCKATMLATALINDYGYRKASEVAMETIDDFQSRLRHIFLAMCNGNDYNTLNLLQIDSAIEALYDTFIAELEKKYTEGGE